jgi:hypothetical protein
MNQNFADRVKLLMEYDTSTTKTENSNRIFENNVLNEQGGILASSLKSGFSGTFDDILRGVSKAQQGVLKSVKGKNGAVIKNLDDLITSIEKGLITPTTMGQIRRGLLKSGKITTQFRDELIDDLLSVPGVLQKGGNTEDVIKGSYRALGYSDEVAGAIAKRVIKLRKTKGIVPPKPTTATTNITVSQKVKKVAEDFFKRGEKWTTFKRYALRIGIPLAIAAVIWALVSGEEVSDPDVDNTGGGSGGNYRDCNSVDFLSQGCKSNKIKDLQTCIGLTGRDVDGLWGPKTQARMVELGLATGILVSDIEGICNAYNQVKTGSKADLESSREKLQNRQQNRTFSGEEPYADYDTESTPSTQPSETGSTEGPTAEYP